MSPRPALVALALCGAAVGCAPDCPGSPARADSFWEYDEESGVCQPPAYAEEVANAALGTGIWGYGMQCADNDSDEVDCTCNPGDVAECGTFRIIDLDHVNGWPYDTLIVRVRGELGFQAKLPPGVRYRFGGPPGFDYGTTADGEPAGVFTLERGELRFFRASVGTEC